MFEHSDHIPRLTPKGKAILSFEGPKDVPFILRENRLNEKCDGLIRIEEYRKALDILLLLFRESRSPDDRSHYRLKFAWCATMLGYFRRAEEIILQSIEEGYSSSDLFLLWAVIRFTAADAEGAFQKLDEAEKQGLIPAAGKIRRIAIRYLNSGYKIQNPEIRKDLNKNKVQGDDELRRARLVDYFAAFLDLASKYGRPVFKVWKTKLRSETRPAKSFESAINAFRYKGIDPLLKEQLSITDPPAIQIPSQISDSKAILLKTVKQAELLLHPKSDDDGVDKNTAEKQYLIDKCREECKNRKLKKRVTIGREVKYAIAKTIGVRDVGSLDDFKPGQPAYQLISKMLHTLGYSGGRVTKEEYPLRAKTKAAEPISRTKAKKIYKSYKIFFNTKHFEFRKKNGTTHGATKYAAKETAKEIYRVKRIRIKPRNIIEAMHRRTEREPMDT